MHRAHMPTSSRTRICALQIYDQNTKQSALRSHSSLSPSSLLTTAALPATARRLRRPTALRCPQVYPAGSPVLLGLRPLPDTFSREPTSLHLHLRLGSRAAPAHAAVLGAGARGMPAALSHIQASSPLSSLSSLLPSLSSTLHIHSHIMSSFFTPQPYSLLTQHI